MLDQATRLLAATGLAAMIVAMPVTFSFDATGFRADQSSAAAKDDGDDESNDGSDHDSADDGADDSDGDRDTRGGSRGQRRGGDRDDPRTGTKITVFGGNIEILHPHGWKEELENGVYEMKDPQGRTVVRRRATSEDIARMQAFVR